MSFKNCWMISSSYDFQAHQQCSQSRCCFSQTALLWFEVLPALSPALPGLSPALLGAPRVVVSAPRVVAGTPSYSEGRQECPPRVWYSPEIDASKFSLHILSDTPGGFQCQYYILLMYLQPVNDQVWRCTWRPWSSQLQDVLPTLWATEVEYEITGSDRARLVNDLEVLDLEAVNGWRTGWWDRILWLVKWKPLECDKVTLPLKLLWIPG